MVPKKASRSITMPYNGCAPCVFKGRRLVAKPHAARPPQLYLEPSELTFNVYFQSGEHGLVLMGQVLESAEVTVTGTPRFCWIPEPLLTSASLGLWAGRYLAENSSKSDSRSQMRRPVRAALDE